MSNAVVYVRVSTEEQAGKAQNLPTQKRKCEARCEQEGLTVAKVFTDAGQSARTTERPEFQAMLEYCRKHKGKISHVVFADLSRLARNVADQSVTLTTFRQLGITPISCDETIENSAAGKLSVNLLGVVNEFFSDSLSERIKYRMAAGVQQGRWLWVAPIGYLNERTQNGPELHVDGQRAVLVRKAFELTATRSYTLEEVLRRVNLLGLTTRKGQPLTKQTFSKLLRNPIYAGWIVSGENKVKGLHEPLVTQSLFDDVQDALAGKTSTAVVHKKVNADFPLKGFVMCSACGKKLTAGFAKGRKEKYPRYWCWNTKCPGRVSASRDEIEMAFVTILGMMEPTQELLNRLPEIARTHWKHRLERITTERRTLSARLTEVRTLNRKILLQKVNGELSGEDFEVLKENVTQQTTELQTQLNALDTESSTVGRLMEETKRSIVDLVSAWRTGGVQQRQELAFSLYPDGLRYSPETKYFEPHNTLLMNSLQEMIDGLVAGSIVGVPDGI
ncbi:MAG: recombinase family protein [Candidatus Sulfotelmatobacter sp.]